MKINKPWIYFIMKNIFDRYFYKTTILCLAFILYQKYFSWWNGLNPLNTSPTKWSSTLKQFVDNLPTNYLSVFDQLVKLALKGLRLVYIKPSRPVRFKKLYWNKKVTWIFIFTLLCSASKGFMRALNAFIKPFEALQRGENKNFGWFFLFIWYWDAKG